jgi:hypothetical protein
MFALFEDTIQLSLAHRREPQVIFLGEADLRANRPEESLCDGISAGIDGRRRRDRSRSIAITACRPEVNSTWTSAGWPRPSELAAAAAGAAGDGVMTDTLLAKILAA